MNEVTQVLTLPAVPRRLLRQIEELAAGQRPPVRRNDLIVFWLEEHVRQAEAAAAGKVPEAVGEPRVAL